MCVFVVAKNVRAELKIASGRALRAGLAMQGLKPNSFMQRGGMAKAMP
jgi:hypothetical protein